MRRRVLAIAIIAVFAICALAFAQQVQRTSSAEDASARCITIGVRKTSTAAQYDEGSAAPAGLSYSVQVTDEAGRTVSGPVTMVVNVPKTHESVGNKWDDVENRTPDDALPAAKWGVLVPLPDDFAQAPPLNRSTSEAAMLANIVYSYEEPEARGHRLDRGMGYGYPSDTVTQFYSISCAEFRPFDSGQTYKNGPWELRATNIVGSNAFVAPVHLPDGVEVTELRVWVYDNDSRGDLVATLDAVGLGEIGPSYNMAQVASGGRGGVQELVSYGVQYGNINNSAFKYTITVAGFSGTAHHRLLGARIQYEGVIGGSPVPDHAVHGW